MKVKEKMDFSEASKRLIAIKEMCQRELTADMLVSTQLFIEKVMHIAAGTEDQYEGRRISVETLEHVIISCDASITENPGGTVSVGIIIEYPGEAPIEHYRIMRKSSTNNEGEYDAVYVGLTQLMNIKNNPTCLIEVRSDSKLVVDQLNGKMKCNKKELQRRRDAIWELARALPVPVKFEWRPRNSTPALEKANYLAQDVLGVSRH